MLAQNTVHIGAIRKKSERKQTPPTTGDVFGVVARVRSPSLFLHPNTLFTVSCTSGDDNKSRVRIANNVKFLIRRAYDEDDEELVRFLSPAYVWDGL